MTRELIPRLLQFLTTCLLRRRSPWPSKASAISVFAATVVCATSSHLSNAQPPPDQAPSPTSLSPDKKWEYKPATNDRGPQIVKAGTDEAAGDLSCDISTCGDGARVLWAPDSKRFAFSWGQGRTHQTSFYQLRGDHWEAPKSSPGEGASQRVESELEAQLKRNHVSQAKLEKKGCICDSFRRRRNWIAGSIPTPRFSIPVCGRSSRNWTIPAKCPTGST